jgi:hypothetical protein
VSITFLPLKKKKLSNILSALLWSSIISLSVGGFLLYWYNLVPPSLLELTGVAVVILIPLAINVYKKNLLAINISTVLGFVAPTISLSTPAHLAVLKAFGQDPLLSVLGLLQFLGFYIFPIAFIILRFVYWKRISIETKTPYDKRREHLGSA